MKAASRESDRGRPGSRARAPRALDLAIFLVLCGYAVAFLVGLPLYADGAAYYFELVTEGSPVLPNLRVTAVVPQLPALMALAVSDDAVLVRHAFAAGYLAVPTLSLLACWLVTRRRRPELMAFVLLSFLALQLNFSGVSELLTGLYLAWPLVLAMALMPERRWVAVYAFLAGPLLLLLHPLSFLPAFGLALLAWLLSRRPDAHRRAWRWLALWLAANGLGRLLWTALGLNPYERGRLEPASAANYLMTETLAQHLLVATVVAAILLAAWIFRARGQARDEGRAARALLLVSGLLAVLAATVGLELVAGSGIQLKAASTFLVGLLAMAAAVWTVLYRPGPPGESGAVLRLGRSPLLLPAVAILILLLAKSSAWWTATRGLQNLVASAEEPCIVFEPQAPYALQWPWMAIVDDWAAPVNALAFRPHVPCADGEGIEPISLLLKRDRCQVLRDTGEAHLTGWLRQPWEVLEARFGPLRRP